MSSRNLMGIDGDFSLFMTDLGGDMVRVELEDARTGGCFVLELDDWRFGEVTMLQGDDADLVGVCCDSCLSDRFEVFDHFSGLRLCGACGEWWNAEYDRSFEAQCFKLKKRLVRMYATVFGRWL